ncbi:hypothetical protein YC2023_025274 [Brassica napus]
MMETIFESGCGMSWYANMYSMFSVIESLKLSWQSMIDGCVLDDKHINNLEAFGKTGLSVAQARASCQATFVMEAIVVSQSKAKLWSVYGMTDTLVRALYPMEYIGKGN